MSAINYTSTFFEVVVFADSPFPLLFLLSKLWIKTIWNIKMGLQRVFMLAAYVNGFHISYPFFKQHVMIWNLAAFFFIIVFIE